MEAGDQAVLNIQTKDYDDKNPKVTATGYILEKIMNSNEQQSNEWTAGMNGYAITRVRIFDNERSKSPERDIHTVQQAKAVSHNTTSRR